MTHMMTTQTDHPTTAERFRFDVDGYLVLENLLAPDHVTALLQAADRAVTRRRTLLQEGIPHTGQTHGRAPNARLFYILDDDPLFLELLDWPAIWPYVTGLLNVRPHHHASDLIVEYPEVGRGMGWHLDGHDDGYRGLGRPIPLLQLKIGYYLTDMTEPGRGNLCVVPGSHKACHDPDPNDLKRTDLFPGAVQVCAPAGSAVLFHNALWHSSGPWTREDGARIMLYYAYEHPWMLASAEHWNYSRAFYDRLSPDQRKLFHGFVFDPPEQRGR
jgi:hypothetical protein